MSCFGIIEKQLNGTKVKVSTGMMFTQEFH
jgi:hypothetical protein